jgi:hypothetical protein
LLDALALGQRTRPRLFIHDAAVQVLDGPSLRDGYFLSRSRHRGRNVAGESFKVLEQHLPVPKKMHHRNHIGQEAPRAAKANPIKAMQYSQDVVAESLYKGLHGVAPCVREWDGRYPNSTNQEQLRSFVAAALPR